MKAPSKMTFEEALIELESLVDGLESGDLSLDQALTDFEKGVALIKHCRAKLDSAEQRVNAVLKDLDGKPIGEEPFVAKEG